ncbi:MAG TPA: isoprenylcysteine carboxylmethyltransferase family protein [Pirellulales bacterium]|jgi:protein-S-isoprenylcysteine O-methyltransferase Ste14|nr:isoprenylcysteine carboxylmethyltransferase family protein [Pirellulales bacterium]
MISSGDFAAPCIEPALVDQPPAGRYPSASRLPTAAKVRPATGVAFRFRGAVGGVVVAAGLVAVFCSANPIPRHGTWGDVALDATAWALFLAGTMLRFWATLYVGGRKARSLVVTGPYSMMRHPLYVGTFLIAASAPVFTHSVTFGVLVALGIAFYVRGTVVAEERQLRQLWGARFDDYRRAVPAFWPRLSRFTAGDSIEVNIRSLGLECRRAMWWVWLPVLYDIVSHVRLQPWWPTPFTLP